MKIKFRNGDVIEMEDGQERLIRLLYGNVFGRMALKVLTLPWISVTAGHILSTRMSCLLIDPFIRNNHIDMRQFEKKRYRSYNEFFSRKIADGARPVDREKTHLISPCDSKLTVVPITEKCRLTLKHTDYTVASLLKNKELAKEFAGGYALVFRLTVDDYHRYCYVADGTKTDNVFIPGVLHTVNPIANDYYPIYKENSREYTLFHTETFGTMLQMEVGALMVGKIVNHHGKAEVSRGEEKGYFQFGGSTVVLLVKAGVVEIDEDLIENSFAGIETVVKLGEKIGTAKK